jgi:hypothetical protein
LLHRLFLTIQQSALPEVAVQGPGKANAKMARLLQEDLPVLDLRATRERGEIPEMKARALRKKVHTPEIRSK